MNAASLATHLVRRAIDARSEAERLAEFNAKTAPRPVILSAINMFGRPQAGLAKGELFPDAEVTLAGLAPIVRNGRVVLAIDPLPAFFLAAGAGPLEERVRQTAWEVLYELSWFELLSELVTLLPDASFLVLTGAGVGKDPQATMDTLLGKWARDLPHPFVMLKHLISETGHAVLDRMLTRGEPDPNTLADLYQSFAVAPTKDDLRERLGIDDVTNVLLQQRFDEDLARLSELSRVEVI